MVWVIYFLSIKLGHAQLLFKLHAIAFFLNLKSLFKLQTKNELKGLIDSHQHPPPQKKREKRRYFFLVSYSVIEHSKLARK